VRGVEKGRGADLRVGIAVTEAAPWITRLEGCGTFAFLDLEFARFMNRLSHADSPALGLAAALLSRRRREGHVCLPLDQPEPVEPDIHPPDPAAWEAEIRRFPVVGGPGDYRPLILDGRRRLYLHRFWRYEQALASRIRESAATLIPLQDLPGLRADLDRLFPAGGAAETDWQKVAAFTALTRRFCVITGGPGTGKTTAIVRILALLAQSGGGRAPRISLAAPTGKAAARLGEAIRREKARMDPELAKGIPEAVSTLHRLLGASADGTRFMHHRERPLPVDGVVVDEASMVDLPLMANLVFALPEKARLILLGDKDQLASVEAGAVLGDICDAGGVSDFSAAHCAAAAAATGQAIDCPSPRTDPGIWDCVTALRKNYRFPAESGIGAAARAINAGDAGAAADLLQSGRHSDLAWRELPAPGDLKRMLKPVVMEHIAPLFRRLDDDEAAHAVFGRFRVLCALRQGPFGVVEINRAIASILAEARLIRERETWYPGRPVLITRNHHGLALYNGDLGIAVPGGKGEPGIRVSFPQADGSFRRISPVRVPDHETAFAMTVHKSQGSEWERVLLVLPDRDAPVLTRELIYTAVTRAAAHVEIWGRGEVLNPAVARRIRRVSGLGDALKETARPHPQ